MFKEARNRCGISRDEAAFRLHIGTRTLTNYEHGVSIVPPEIALKMQEAYQDPTLTAKYCSDYCPIGQIFAHQVPGSLSLCQAVIGLLKEHHDVGDVRQTLMAIAQDGLVTPDELPDLERILDKLLALEQRIQELKLVAARHLSLSALMQKRKKPRDAAPVRPCCLIALS